MDTLDGDRGSDRSALRGMGHRRGDRGRAGRRCRGLRADVRAADWARRSSAWPVLPDRARAAGPAAPRRRAHGGTAPWTSAGSPSSSATCSARRWRSRSARCGPTRGSLARSAGRERCAPSARRSRGTRSSFVIPCHRVVRADGRIGEYGAGGPEAKRQVLGVEGVDADELERLADERVRYRGSETTGIYCYPSCRHARRISPRHRVGFASAEDAAAAGFRACRSCRPLEAAVFMASGREERARSRSPRPARA